MVRVSRLFFSFLSFFLCLSPVRGVAHLPALDRVMRVLHKSEYWLFRSYFAAIEMNKKALHTHKISKVNPSVKLSEWMTMCIVFCKCVITAHIITFNGGQSNNNNNT